MKSIYKEHPVYCKHNWQHGAIPVNNPQNPILNQVIPGYFCNRCHTLWKTRLENGIIKPFGEEPKIQIGICEVEIPILSKEPERGI